MRVSIFEYVSGGGFLDRNLPSSILSEGYGMLCSALSDFKEAGYQTYTLLDSRLALFQPPLRADRIHLAKSQEELKIKFMDLLRDADISLLIAPESEGILAKFLSLSEELDIDSLNCTISSISAVCNKLRLYEKLKENGLSVPKTNKVIIEENIEKAQKIVENIGFPIIIKPIEGIGCYGLSFVKTFSQLPLAISKIKEEARTNTYLIQEFVKGIHASVSLISNGKKAIPLTLNLQMIALNPPNKTSSYIGGIVPFDHELKEKAFHIAKRAVELFKGLRGYVGVDLVLSKSGPVLIEINPRLTVSYIGLKRVSNLNLAKAMIKASLEDKLPEDFNPSCYSIFSKEALPALSNDLLKETYSMQEVVTPPFPFNNKNYALLATKGKSLEEAKALFKKARQKLRSIAKVR
ncbi:MAG: ATP-grasp domain-containing protein [archaeon]|nr:ATP-grasp domain-containing protein [archaeon]MCP8319987.1 ATP-grasp domain-containing protein [archaeon]